jgi:hypothetical protein
LFSNKEALHDLWIAADRYDRLHDADALVNLQNAVEKLFPLFGDKRIASELNDLKLYHVRSDKLGILAR